MQRFRMRYLPFISFFVILLSCSSAYKKMQKIPGDAGCVQKFKPQFQGAVYNTKVDVVGNHLSGLLVIKTMPDSSIRMVFSNQMGFKFFDFEFSRDSGFKVHYILKQMDKKAVITTLRKDFELVLMYHTPIADAYLLKNKTDFYYAFPQEKGINYYITDSACTELKGLERASKRKAVVQAIMLDYSNGLPDSIGITHKNFNFTIGLKLLKK